MKKILSITFILFFALHASFAQVDRTHRPEATEARTPQLGQPEVFVLDNGLKVFVVKDSKLPRVSMSLVFNMGPIYEGDKAGFVEMGGELMRAGTTSKTKAELDEEVDFMGASLSVSMGSVYASSLSKYNEDIMAIMADVVMNPAFNAEEFAKIKTKMLSSVESSKDEPSSINRQVYGALIYGKDNPFGEFITEETVNKATAEDCKNLYNTYWKPNIAYLAIVGDIKPKAAKKLAEKYFGNWAQGEVTKYKLESLNNSQPTHVALINRDASVQSVVRIGNRIVLHPGDADIAAMSVANEILGGGMNGRLFRNLREDKAFTYGAYSGYGTSEYVSSFSASAEVRNEVTDSAIAEFLLEINKIRTEDVSENELRLAKSALSGSFGRSLENASTIANFAINIDRYNLPEDYYQNYLTRLQAVTIEDVKRVTNKYMEYNNLLICVTGKASEVGNLAQFGEVQYYDMYANKTTAPMMPVPEGVTVISVIDNYITAIGGKEALAKITSLEMDMEISMAQMPQPLKMKMAQDLTKSYYFMELTMGSMSLEKTTYDGKVGKKTSQGQTVVLEGEELEGVKDQAANAFDELNYFNEGYTVTLVGLKTSDNQKVYVVDITDASGIKETSYYSVETGLKVMTMASQETPQGSMSIVDKITEYKEFNGIKVPAKFTKTMGPQELNFELVKFEANKKFDKNLLN